MHPRERKLSEYIGFPLNMTYKTWAVNHCVGRAYYIASAFLLPVDESWSELIEMAIKTMNITVCREIETTIAKLDFHDERSLYMELILYYGCA